VLAPDKLKLEEPPAQENEVTEAAAVPAVGVPLQEPTQHAEVAPPEVVIVFQVMVVLLVAWSLHAFEKDTYA
jgi:hypothetical protein